MRKQILKSLYRLSKIDKKIVYIGSDLGPDTLTEFKKKYPDRFFMEGAYEQHIISMAAGLALEGFKPYVHTIATFITRRCYEQIYISLGLQNLNVRLIGNGGGLVYSPLGQTHLALDDIALMRSIPNMSIIVPSDAMEMKSLVESSKNHNGPIYFRVAKGDDKVCSNIFKKKSTFSNIQSLNNNSNIMIISTGIMLSNGLQLIDFYTKKNVSIGLIHLPVLSPLKEKKILKLISKTKIIITLEEHSAIGGLGSIISDLITYNNLHIKLVKFTILNKIIKGYGRQHNQLKKNQLDFDSCIKKINKLLNYD